TLASTVRRVASSSWSGTPSPSESLPSATATDEARTTARAAEEANAIAAARVRTMAVGLASRMGRGAYMDIIRRFSKAPGWDLARGRRRWTPPSDHEQGREGERAQRHPEGRGIERQAPEVVRKDPDELVPDLQHADVRPLESDDGGRRIDPLVFRRTHEDPAVEFVVRDEGVRQVLPKGLRLPALDFERREDTDRPPTARGRGSGKQASPDAGKGPVGGRRGRLGRSRRELREHDRLSPLDDGLRVRVREHRIGGPREVRPDAREHRDPDRAEQRTYLGRGVVAVEREQVSALEVRQVAEERLVHMRGGLRRQREDRHRPVVRDLREGPLQLEAFETAGRPAVGDQDEDRLLMERRRRPRPAVDHGEGIGEARTPMGREGGEEPIEVRAPSGRPLPRNRIEGADRWPAERDDVEGF